MRTDLAAVAAQQGGVVMRGQAIAAGYSADDIDHLVRRKEWVSLRRGAYMERDVHDAMTDVERHLALVHAVVRSLQQPAVVSHVSAVVLRGDLPTWGLDLSEVHVSRADLHSPRHEAGIHHHAGALPAEDVEKVNGVRVTTLARTVVDTARTTPFEASVVVADAAFRTAPEAQAVARARLDTMRDWPGARNASAVLAFADRRSESVGESRCRVPVPRGRLARTRPSTGVLRPRWPADRAFRLLLRQAPDDWRVRREAEVPAVTRPGR